MTKPSLALARRFRLARGWASGREAALAPIGAAATLAASPGHAPIAALLGGAIAVAHAKVNTQGSGPLAPPRRRADEPVAWAGLYHPVAGAT